MTHRSRLLFFLFCLPVLAAAKPVFKTSSTDLGTIRPGESLNYDLRPLLVDNGGSSALTWFAGTKPLPAWLKIDSAGSRLTGSPTAADAGANAFQISVRDGEGAAIDHDLTIFVLAPPRWTDTDIDFGIQNEGVAWSTVLTDYVKYDGTDPLSFTVTGLPAWMKFDAATARLSGTPQRGDVGNYAGITLAASGKGGASSVPAHGTVKKTIHPPKWITNGVIALTTDAQEDFDYTADLTPYVINTEGAVLKYAITSALPPAWLHLGNGSGLLYGTPGKPDVGTVTVAVRLSAEIDGVPYEDVTSFRFNVKHTNHPPVWLTKTLQMPPASTKVAYAQNLKNSAKDPDGDALTFAISGPNWLQINAATGDITGTPANTDIPPGGVASWTVTVKDPAGLQDTATLQIQILKSNEPPLWIQKPIVLKDVPEDSTVNVDLAPYARDPDGDPLQFTMLDGPKWVSVSARGILAGIPRTADVGPVKLHVKVDDNIAGSDTVEVTFVVTPVNHKPFWMFSPIVLNAVEDKSTTIDISGYASDPDASDKNTLVFSLVSSPTPAWAQLSPKGVFTGTPAAASVGETKYTVRVADAGGLTADVDVIFKVQHVNHKPAWTVNPIPLTPNAKEGSAYSASLAAFATDPDAGDVASLRFEKAGPLPGWLTLSTDGALSGTPLRPDVGAATFSVRVIDPSGESAQATVTLTVDKTTKPPRWRQNPVLLTNAYEGLNYRFELADYVTGEPGDTLTFTLVSGPRWMAVSANGVISGIPAREDVGPFTATIRVADGTLTADAGATGEVVKRFHGPAITPNPPILTVKERGTLEVQLSDAQFVTNPDGGTLKFSPPQPADWITLSEQGKLVAKPQRAQLGDHAVAFTVENPNGSANGVVTIRVLRDPLPPVWNPATFAFDAPANEPFTASVAGNVTDPNGLGVTYSKVDGKPWLTVNPDGSLTGTPDDGLLGMNTFTVNACNTENACASATVNIKVVPGSTIQIVHLDEPVAGAHAENLWVIDNSTICDATIQALKKQIGKYYDGVKAIAHSGVYLSADAREFDGWPIRGQNQRYLMLPADGNLVANFSLRTDYAYSGGSCSNCDNSPIWSMHRFYERAPKLSEIYHNGYFTAGAPMDVLIVTHQTDHYKAFTADQTATPATFAKEFRDFHRFEKMPYRISVIAPATAALVDRMPTYAGQPNAYQTLVTETKGDYYPLGTGFDMAATLADYGRKVAARANAFAHGTVKLTPPPAANATIRVRLGATELAADAWTYDQANQVVVLNWAKIDPALIQPGTDLKITYRAN